MSSFRQPTPHISTLPPRRGGRANRSAAEAPQIENSSQEPQATGKEKDAERETGVVTRSGRRALGEIGTNQQAAPHPPPSSLPSPRGGRTVSKRGEQKQNQEDREGGGEGQGQENASTIVVPSAGSADSDPLLCAGALSSSCSSSSSSLSQTQKQKPPAPVAAPSQPGIPNALPAVAAPAGVTTRSQRRALGGGVGGAGAASRPPPPLPSLPLPCGGRGGRAGRQTMAEGEVEGMGEGAGGAESQQRRRGKRPPVASPCIDSPLCSPKDTQKDKENEHEGETREEGVSAKVGGGISGKSKSRSRREGGVGLRPLRGIPSFRERPPPVQGRIPRKKARGFGGGNDEGRENSAAGLPLQTRGTLPFHLARPQNEAEGGLRAVEDSSSSSRRSSRRLGEGAVPPMPDYPSEGLGVRDEGDVVMTAVEVPEASGGGAAAAVPSGPGGGLSVSSRVRKGTLSGKAGGGESRGRRVGSEVRRGLPLQGVTNAGVSSQSKGRRGAAVAGGSGSVVSQRGARVSEWMQPPPEIDDENGDGENSAERLSGVDESPPPAFDLDRGERDKGKEGRGTRGARKNETLGLSGTGAAMAMAAAAPAVGPADRLRRRGGHEDGQACDQGVESKGGFEGRGGAKAAGGGVGRKRVDVPPRYSACPCRHPFVSSSPRDGGGRVEGGEDSGAAGGKRNGKGRQGGRPTFRTPRKPVGGGKRKRFLVSPGDSSHSLGASVTAVRGSPIPPVTPSPSSQGQSKRSSKPPVTATGAVQKGEGAGTVGPEGETGRRFKEGSGTGRRESKKSRLGASPENAPAPARVSAPASASLAASASASASLAASASAAAASCTEEGPAVRVVRMSRGSVFARGPGAREIVVDAGGCPPGDGRLSVSDEGDTDREGEGEREGEGRGDGVGAGGSGSVALVPFPSGDSGVEGEGVGGPPGEAREELALVAIVERGEGEGEGGEARQEEEVEKVDALVPVPSDADAEGPVAASGGADGDGAGRLALEDVVRSLVLVEEGGLSQLQGDDVQGTEGGQSSEEQPPPLALQDVQRGEEGEEQRLVAVCESSPAVASELPNSQRVGQSSSSGSLPLQDASSSGLEIVVHEGAASAESVAYSADSEVGALEGAQSGGEGRPSLALERVSVPSDVGDGHPLALGECPAAGEGEGEETRLVLSGDGRELACVDGHEAEREEGRGEIVVGLEQQREDAPPIPLEDSPLALPDLPRQVAVREDAYEAVEGEGEGEGGVLEHGPPLSLEDNNQGARVLAVVSEGAEGEGEGEGGGASLSPVRENGSPLALEDCHRGLQALAVREAVSEEVEGEGEGEGGGGGGRLVDASLEDDSPLALKDNHHGEGVGSGALAVAVEVEEGGDVSLAALENGRDGGESALVPVGAVGEETDLGGEGSGIPAIEDGVQERNAIVLMEGPDLGAREASGIAGDTDLPAIEDGPGESGMDCLVVVAEGTACSGDGGQLEDLEGSSGHLALEDGVLALPDLSAEERRRMAEEEEARQREAKRVENNRKAAEACARMRVELQKLEREEQEMKRILEESEREAEHAESLAARTEKALVFIRSLGASNFEALVEERSLEVGLKELIQDLRIRQGLEDEKMCAIGEELRRRGLRAPFGQAGGSSPYPDYPSGAVSGDGHGGTVGGSMAGASSVGAAAAVAGGVQGGSGGLLSDVGGSPDPSLGRRGLGGASSSSSSSFSAGAAGRGEGNDNWERLFLMSFSRRRPGGSTASSSCRRPAPL